MKLFVDQQVRGIDLLRAFLMFPIDLAFLALSFGVAVFSYVQTKNNTAVNSEGLLVIFVVFVIANLIVIAVAKKSDKAFVEERKGWMVALVVPGYVISLSIMAACFWYMGVL